MPQHLHLDGAMIPRSVKRQFDQRTEPRIDAGRQSAMIDLGGRSHLVPLINLSSSGAMIRFAGALRIGDPLSVQLVDHGEVAGRVSWVRDGRVGICFDRPIPGLAAD